MMNKMIYVVAKFLAILLTLIITYIPTWLALAVMALILNAVGLNGSGSRIWLAVSVLALTPFVYFMVKDNHFIRLAKMSGEDMDRLAAEKERKKNG